MAVGSIETLGVAVGGIAGLLIVNVLPKEQYAQYTFLVACSMTLMIGISDLGLAHVRAAGDRHSRRRATRPGWSGLCNQIFSWRWAMLAAGMLVVGPYWYLNSHERGWMEPAYWVATALYFAILVALLLALREHFSAPTRCRRCCAISPPSTGSRRSPLPFGSR